MQEKWLKGKTKTADLREVPFCMKKKKIILKKGKNYFENKSFGLENKCLFLLKKVLIGKGSLSGKGKARRGTAKRQILTTNASHARTSLHNAIGTKGRAKTYPN